MATQLTSTIRRWIGLSSDIKPTGVPIMSYFYEYDTREWYVSYDGTNWTKYK